MLAKVLLAKARLILMESPPGIDILPHHNPGALMSNNHSHGENLCSTGTPNELQSR